jgi:glycosyltransferase involved in cell wall biosynthesis
MSCLLILTQYFPPEMGAPQARLSELGERLIDLGWDVEVLTALPNYPRGVVYPGYRRWRTAVEPVGRMRTVRVPLYTAKHGVARRLASYLSFAASAWLLGARRCARPDLMLVESPPLFIALAAIRLARRWHCPWVLNVSDLWPAAAVQAGIVKRGMAIRLAEKLEVAIYRRACGVSGQSDDIVAGVRDKVQDVPTAVVTNGVDPGRFGRRLASAEARALLGTEPGPVFVYAGLFGKAQGLDQILDLARALPADVGGRFVLVGDGPERERLEARVRAERIDRVRLLPVQPRDEVPALLANADAAIISLGMTIPGAVPSKIYEAMASELPILLIADGEAARRVTDAGAGIAVAPGDRAGLREAFERLATDDSLRARLGSAGRRAAETTYNRDAIARRLDAFLRERLNA